MKHNNPTRQVSMRMFLTLVLIMMSSAFVMAQEKYGFKVAGVDVTSDNYLNLLTSSLRHPKIFIKEFGDFLMPCHQHCLSVYILVQR